MTATGNRCGHDRRRPRLELERPDTKKPFPWIIKQALERLEGLYRDRRLFPELGARKRSERIEAMVLVGRAILRTCDRVTLRSGVYVDGVLVAGLTMKTIARWARIQRQRAFRACWDLRDAGYVTCHQPIEERPNGDRRGLAGIRCATPTLFERLGLGGRLKAERKSGYAQQRAANRAATIAENKARRRLRRAQHTAARATTAPKPTYYGGHTDEQAAKRQIALDMAARRLRDRT